MMLMTVAVRSVRRVDCVWSTMAPSGNAAMSRPAEKSDTAMPVMSWAVLSVSLTLSMGVVVDTHVAKHVVKHVAKHVAKLVDVAVKLAPSTNART